MLKLIRAEFYKMKHTPFNLIHLSIPFLAVAAFLLYYSFSPQTSEEKVVYYVTTLALAFPIMISIVCSYAIETEQAAGNYKEIIGQKYAKASCFVAKLIMLLIMGFVAIGIAVLGFAAGFQLILKDNNYTISFYFMVICIMFASEIIIYVFHMILGFYFGKGISLMAGAFGSLGTMLMMSDLGEHIWRFVPWSYGVRFTGYYMAADDMEFINKYIDNIRSGIIIAGIMTIVVTLAAVAWFNTYEGRKSQD